MKQSFLLSLLVLLVACGKGGKSSKGFQLSEDIQMTAAVYGNEIQLSNVLKSLSTSPNVCGPSPMPGKIYSYSLMNGVLTLDDMQNRIVYRSVVNNGGVFGTWQMVSTTDPRMKSGTVEITYNSVRFISVCAN